MGAELGDAEMDPPPCLTHRLPCRAETRHPALLPRGPRLTIAPEKPTPLAQNPPAENMRCDIPPTAVSKDFFRKTHPRESFYFRLRRQPPAPLPSRDGETPLTPQGLPGSLGAQQDPGYPHDPQLAPRSASPTPAPDSSSGRGGASPGRGPDGARRWRSLIEL